MDSQTKLKLLKELDGYRKQDITKLPTRQQLTIVKRIREISLLVREPVSIDKSRLSSIVVAVSPDGREHRVIGLDGNPDLGMIPEGIEGVKSAPIRLQEETLKNGHLQRHLEDLQKAGYVSVEDAVIDIAKNYEQVYEGKKDKQLVLVKPVELRESEKIRRGILLTEFQEVAGVYRIGSVLATSRSNYLEDRRVLWDRSLSIVHVTRNNAPRGLTGPEPSSASNDTTSTVKAQNAEQLARLMLKSLDQRIDIPNAFRRKDMDAPIDLRIGDKKNGIDSYY